MAKYRALSVVAALLAVALFLPSAGIAADAKCEPDKLATKYPSLVGKTIKIGTDGETPPYAMRDSKDFSQLIGSIPNWPKPHSNASAFRSNSSSERGLDNSPP